MYAGDIFYMGACQLCRGCQANEKLYGDRRIQGKMPPCSEIPKYVPPRPTLSPAERESREYLRIERRCGLTDAFDFPGDYFANDKEKKCYCCLGRVKNGGKFDNCNCNNMADDCFNTEALLSDCGDFMKKYNISVNDIPKDYNVNLSDAQSKAIRGGYDSGNKPTPTNAPTPTGAAPTPTGFPTTVPPGPTTFPTGVPTTVPPGPTTFPTGFPTTVPPGPKQSSQGLPVAFHGL
jgi:hypothetical protein